LYHVTPSNSIEHQCTTFTGEGEEEEVLDDDGDEGEDDDDLLPLFFEM
jgi:hypothetical protein